MVFHLLLTLPRRDTGKRNFLGLVLSEIIQEWYQGDQENRLSRMVVYSHPLEFCMIVSVYSESPAFAVFPDTVLGGQ